MLCVRVLVHTEMQTPIHTCQRIYEGMKKSSRPDPFPPKNDQMSKHRFFFFFENPFGWADDFSATTSYYFILVIVKKFYKFL